MHHVLLRKLAVLVLVAFRLAIRTPATAARVVTTSLLLADGICNAVCNWCNCAVLRAVQVATTINMSILGKRLEKPHQPHKAHITSRIAILECRAVFTGSCCGQTTVSSCVHSALGSEIWWC